MGPVFPRAQTLAFLLLLLPADRTVATDLKITDSLGTEVVVTGATIDYSGMLTSDKETQGIRVLQGDGVVLLKWTDVESLTIRNNGSAKPPRMELDVALRNGKKAAATVLKKGHMKLLGKTDLGDYSIDLDKVRAIAPVR